MKKPIDIRDDYFKKSTELLDSAGSPTPSGSLVAHAIIYHECAIFAERQYHAIIHSPDAIRWKVYVDRKRQEIESRRQEIARTQNETRVHNLRADQAKAEKLLKEDNQLFQTHNVDRYTFLKQAIDMYSRCLQASDSFDDDAAIRLCSLWFANFEVIEMGLQNEVQIALGRIPSRKLVFLAVRCCLVLSVVIRIFILYCATVAPTLCSNFQTANWPHLRKPGKPSKFSHSNVS